MTKKIHCQKCGAEHNEILENCCWIECVCGKKICGRCGSKNISEIENDENEEEIYWCHLECEDCGLQGCGMCE